MLINSEQSIVCSARDSKVENNLSFFQDYHKSYMPLMYPLLFPHGTDGWSLETRTTRSPYKKATLAQYTRFRRMNLSTYSIVLHIANNLYQQYIVDVWGILENSRITWMQNNQRMIRADIYNRVTDAVRSGDAARSGATVLASSFTGGD